MWSKKTMIRMTRRGIFLLLILMMLHTHQLLRNQNSSKNNNNKFSNKKLHEEVQVHAEGHRDPIGEEA
jgi:hypothetical protein